MKSSCLPRSYLGLVWEVEEGTSREMFMCEEEGPLFIVYLAGLEKAVRPIRVDRPDCFDLVT